MSFGVRGALIETGYITSEFPVRTNWWLCSLSPKLDFAGRAPAALESLVNRLLNANVDVPGAFYERWPGRLVYAEFRERRVTIVMEEPLADFSAPTERH